MSASRNRLWSLFADPRLTASASIVAVAIAGMQLYAGIWQHSENVAREAHEISSARCAGVAEAFDVWFFAETAAAAKNMDLKLGGMPTWGKMDPGVSTAVARGELVKSLNAFQFTGADFEQMADDLRVTVWGLSESFDKLSYYKSISLVSEEAAADRFVSMMDAALDKYTWIAYGCGLDPMNVKEA